MADTREQIPSDVDWSRLSATGADTLKRIVLPRFLLGLSNAEVAERAGFSQAWVAHRMRLLRREIRAQSET